MMTASNGAEGQYQEDKYQASESRLILFLTGKKYTRATRFKGNI